MSIKSAESCLLNWRKSARSIGNGDCVELASANGHIAVRDSKDPSGPILCYSASSWQSFLAAVRQKNLGRLP